MQEQLKSLLNRYQNKLELKDLYENDVVILFNEERIDILKKMKSFSRSKFCELENPEITKYEFRKEFTDKWREMNALTGMRATPVAFVDKVTHKFDVMGFFKYGIERGFDWVIYLKKDWEALQTKKKRKFIKPKRR